MAGEERGDTERRPTERLLDMRAEGGRKARRRPGSRMETRRETGTTAVTGI